jgi:hypothetical protein
LKCKKFHANSDGLNFIFAEFSTKFPLLNKKKKPKKSNNSSWGILRKILGNFWGIWINEISCSSSMIQDFMRFLHKFRLSQKPLKFK